MTRCAIVATSLAILLAPASIAAADPSAEVSVSNGLTFTLTIREVANQDCYARRPARSRDIVRLRLPLSREGGNQQLTFVGEDLAGSGLIRTVLAHGEVWCTTVSREALNVLLLERQRASLRWGYNSRGWGSRGYNRRLLDPPGTYIPLTAPQPSPNLTATVDRPTGGEIILRLPAVLVQALGGLRECVGTCSADLGAAEAGVTRIVVTPESGVSPQLKFGPPPPTRRGRSNPNERTITLTPRPCNLEFATTLPGLVRGADVQRVRTLTRCGAEALGDGETVVLVSRGERASEVRIQGQVLRNGHPSSAGRRRGGRAAAGSLGRNRRTREPITLVLRDIPREPPPSVTWTIETPNGAEIGEIVLPTVERLRLHQLSVRYGYADLDALGGGPAFIPPVEAIPSDPDASPSVLLPVAVVDPSRLGAQEIQFCPAVRGFSTVCDPNSQTCAPCESRPAGSAQVQGPASSRASEPLTGVVNVAHLVLPMGHGRIADRDYVWCAGSPDPDIEIVTANGVPMPPQRWSFVPNRVLRVRLLEPRDAEVQVGIRLVRRSDVAPRCGGDLACLRRWVLRLPSVGDDAVAQLARQLRAAPLGVLRRHRRAWRRAVSRYRTCLRGRSPAECNADPLYVVAARELRLLERHRRPIALARAALGAYACETGTVVVDTRVGIASTARRESLPIPIVDAISLVCEYDSVERVEASGAGDRVVDQTWEKARHALRTAAELPRLARVARQERAAVEAAEDAHTALARLGPPASAVDGGVPPPDGGAPSAVDGGVPPPDGGAPMLLQLRAAAGETLRVARAQAAEAERALDSARTTASSAAHAATQSAARARRGASAQRARASQGSDQAARQAASLRAEEATAAAEAAEATVRSFEASERLAAARTAEQRARRLEETAGRSFSDADAERQPDAGPPPDAGQSGRATEARDRVALAYNVARRAHAIARTSLERALTAAQTALADAEVALESRLVLEENRDWNLGHYVARDGEITAPGSLENCRLIYRPPPVGSPTSQIARLRLYGRQALNVRVRAHDQSQPVGSEVNFEAGDGRGPISGSLRFPLSGQQEDDFIVTAEIRTRRRRVPYRLDLVEVSEDVVYSRTQYRFRARVRPRGWRGVLAFPLDQAFPPDQVGSSRLEARMYFTAPLVPFALRFPAASRELASSEADPNVQITALRTGLLLVFEPWDYRARRNPWLLSPQLRAGVLTNAAGASDPFPPTIVVGVAITTSLLRLPSQSQFDTQASVGFYLEVDPREDGGAHFLITASVDVLSLLSPPAGGESE